MIRLEAIIENRAQLYIKEIITEKPTKIAKEIIKEEIQKQEEIIEEIPVKKSLLSSYLDKLKVSFTNLFTSDVVKTVQQKKISYLVIAIISIIILLLSIFLKRKTKKKKLARKKLHKKDFKFKIKY